MDTAREWARHATREAWHGTVTRSVPLRAGAGSAVPFFPHYSLPLSFLQGEGSEFIFPALSLSRAVPSNVKAPTSNLLRNDESQPAILPVACGFSFIPGYISDSLSLCLVLVALLPLSCVENSSLSPPFSCLVCFCSGTGTLFWCWLLPFWCWLCACLVPIWCSIF